ncbi:MAG: PDZ domain-containing protein, partial [Planctomycetota bacterium]
MLPGDVITHINGKPITDMAEVKIATALGKDGKAVAMTVQREGEAEPLIFDITAKASAQNEGLLSAGIYPADTLTLAESAAEAGRAAISPQSQLAELALTPGMRLTSVNGTAVENLGQYRRAIEQLDDPKLTLVFTDPDTGEQIESTLNASPSLTRQDERTHLLGLLPVSTVAPSSEKSRAAQAGVESGDVVVKLGEAAWPSPRRLQDVVKGNAGGPLPITVWRDGAAVELQPITPKNGLIGVGLAGYYQINRVGGVLAESPFARAAADRPLPAGSVLAAVNGEPIEDWTDFQYAVMQGLTRAEAGQPAEFAMDFEVNLGETADETYQVALTAEEADALRQELAWGRPAGIGFEPMMTEVKAGNPVEATVIGAVKTKEFIQQTYITLLRLFQGSIKVN